MNPDAGGAYPGKIPAQHDTVYAGPGGGVNNPPMVAPCAQECTLATWNEPNASFVNEKCIVKLVRILCTEARYPFISVANNPLRPVNDHVSFSLQVPVEGGPREPTIG